MKELETVAPQQKTPRPTPAYAPSIQAYIQIKAEAIHTNLHTSIWLKQSRSNTHKNKADTYTTTPPDQVLLLCEMAQRVGKQWSFLLLGLWLAFTTQTAFSPFDLIAAKVGSVAAIAGAVFAGLNSNWYQT